MLIDFFLPSSVAQLLYFAKLLMDYSEKDGVFKKRR